MGEGTAASSSVEQEVIMHLLPEVTIPVAPFFRELGILRGLCKSCFNKLNRRRDIETIVLQWSNASCCVACGGELSNLVTARGGVAAARKPSLEPPANAFDVELTLSGWTR